MSFEGYGPDFPTPGVPTPVPNESERIARMKAAGVAEEHWDWMGTHGTSAMSAKLGLKFVEMSAEKMVGTVPVGGNEQNAGLFHGGGHFVIAETLGSIAAIFHVRANLGMDRQVVGTELSATHHRAATSGLVWGTCTPINLGKQLTVHEIVMRDEKDRRLSTARMTNMILHPRG